MSQVGQLEKRFPAKAIAIVRESSTGKYSLIEQVAP